MQILNQSHPDFVGPKISASLKYYRNNTEKVRERRKKHYYENRDRMLRNQREYKLKQAYGITIEEFDALSSAQNHVCAICEKPSSDGKRLHIDHCHETGKIRGLLCNRCNPAIGALGDTEHHLRRAIAYLSGELQCKS